MMVFLRPAFYATLYGTRVNLACSLARTCLTDKNAWLSGEHLIEQISGVIWLGTCGKSLCLGILLKTGVGSLLGG